MSPLEQRYRDLLYEYIERCYVRFYNNPDPGKIRDMLVIQRAKDKQNEETNKQAEDLLTKYGGFDESAKQDILQTLKEQHRAN